MSNGKTVDVGKDLNKTKLKILELEIDVLLEEYKAIRAELILTMTNTRQILNFSLLSMGFLISGFFKIVDLEFFFIFLIIPFFFYGLAGVFLRYILLHIELTEYLRRQTLPRINENLSVLRAFEKEVLTWENKWGYIAAGSRYNFPLSLIPAIPVLVPLLGASLSILIYFYNQPICFMNISYFWKETNIFEKLLIFGNIVSFSYITWACIFIGKGNTAIKKFFRKDSLSALVEK